MYCSRGLRGVAGMKFRLALLQVLNYDGTRPRCLEQYAGTCCHNKSVVILCIASGC